MSEKFDKLWDESFALLKEYKNQHGHCDVVRRDGKLGGWISRQRDSYKRGALAKIKTEKLDSLGFVWEGVRNKSHDNSWDAKYKALVAYQEKHNHCCILTTEGSLGIWVARQRKSHNKGKLSQDKISRLNSIGFVWSMDEARWVNKFEQLREYKQKHGSFNVSLNLKNLNYWVNHQRSRYKKGLLQKERVDKLEGIGFNWEGRKIKNKG